MPTNRGYQEGSAVVGALWYSLILALISLSILFISRDFLLDAKLKRKLEEAWAKSDSATVIAIANLAPQMGEWRVRKEPYHIIYEGEEVQISIQSPRGKFDLNFASGAQLRRLFEALGYAPQKAAQMADAILDWRDEDDLVHLNGAERNEYAKAGYDYGPENSSFETVENLKRVIGFNDRVFACIRPFVTIFSGSIEVDTHQMHSQLRRRLGYAEESRDNEFDPGHRGDIGEVYIISAFTPISDFAFAQTSRVIRFTGSPEDPIWTHQIFRTIARREQIVEQPVPKFCPIQLGEK